MPLGFSLRNLGRLRQIFAVLVVEFGLGSLFDQLDLGRFLPLGRRRRLARAYEGMSSAKRLRLALEHLGPSFIKLGQILSARPDLLPPEMIAELRRLQDEAPTVPFERIRGVIEAEFGQPLSHVFATFDPVPLSSASLGQVHAATLREGREVTVKVLRPGVEAVVQSDLQVFAEAAAVVDRQVSALRRYDLPGFVRQFADQIHAEMVYTIEAHNTERARRLVAEQCLDLIIPEVIASHTTRRVLTEEHIYGHRVDRPDQAAVPADRPALAREFGQFVLQQIFVDGFFHGDPHQGNVLITNDGRLALLDWGIVGYLDPKLRRSLADVLRAMHERDTDWAVAAVTELGAPRPETDLVSLRQELARVIVRAEVLPPREFSIGEMLSSTIRAMAMHDIRVPMELSLAAKALVVGEGVCTDLDPGFDFREVVQPVVEQERQRQQATGAILDRATHSLQSLARQLARVPSRVDMILSHLERGTIRIRIEDKDADRRIQELSRSLNRLSLSLLAASSLIAGAMYMVISHRATHAGLGVVALVIAAFLGTIVVLSVLRWRRI